MTTDAPATDLDFKLATLKRAVRSRAPLTIAVSGGVDSMTLAAFAARNLPTHQVQMVHAASPAVPKAAFARVKALAQAEAWRLEIVDAGELADPHYRANPINRCFFCKSNLYRTLSDLADGAIASGTNCDDLADFRPGLAAAANHNVCHPYVEAGMTKSDVRALARALELHQLAELPASPCLSSRVETGLSINESDLQLIDQIESWLWREVEPRTARCRIRQSGIVLELDEHTLAGLSSTERANLLARLHRECAGLVDQHRSITFAPYRQGSAFVGNKAADNSSGATSP